MELSSPSHQLSFLLGIGLLFLVLVACATTQAPQILCLPMVQYTADQQHQMLEEYKGLPAQAFLRTLVSDYLHLRDANRVACQGAH